MSNRLSMQVGFWASTVLAVLGAIYLVLLLANFATRGFSFPPPAYVQTIGGLVTILSAPAILIIFAAVKDLAPPEKSVLGTVGLAFGILFVAMVTINRFVQLTIVRLSSTPADLGRFLPYSADSVMFALEILGWGFFLSIACLFIAPLFSGPGLQRSIRWFLILFAVFSFMSVIGFSTTTPISVAAFVAWGPILLALAISLAIMFRRGQSPYVSR